MAKAAKVTIGKRTQVEDITSVWSKETEFSDWLVTSDGAELIAQDLEIEIENARREAKGSNFSCDVVANVVGDEKHVVVIENQFGRTNHDHLAKLLTYAAVHKAMTGIWIAEDAADDHRQVIDWLNANTPDTVALYLAELKAYTIAGSPAAPQLDVVCRPNVTMKRENTDQTEAEKKRHAWRLAYWQAIHDTIKATRPPFRLQRPGQDHWSSIAVGRSGFSLSMLLTPKNKSIAIEVVIKPQDWKSQAFSQLKDQQAEIEKAVGKPLDWREMPDQASSRVLLEEKLDPSEDSNKKRVCEWFAHWTPILYNAFSGRIKALSAPDDV